MAKEPVTPVDGAWLRMEDPTNLMMVSGILTFDQPVDFEQLKQMLQARLLKFERFRQRIVESNIPMRPAYWEDDPYFDINSHLHRIALPQPGDQQTLQKLVSDLMSTPLDFSKPLWQIHVIEGYGNGCAIMSRLHHAMADGMALVYVLLSMTEFSDTPKDYTAEAEEDEPLEEKSRGLIAGTVGKLFKQASSTVNLARSLTGRVMDEGRGIITDPSRILDLAKQGADYSVAAGRLTLRSPDPQTIFKGELGVAKLAAWSRPLPLSQVKAIKKVTGGTVNDVLVTAMTGGLRKYMEHRGVPVDGVEFRAAVPVNLRKPEEMGEMGNKFGLVFLKLPVGIADTLERLVEVNRRMTALKNSPEAVASFGILNIMGSTPADIQAQMVGMFGAKATAVMTNVPGPPVPLYLVGREIKDLMFWVPQSGRVSLGVSIISYAGKVFLGVTADAGLVPEPQRIIDGFYEEYETLVEMSDLAKKYDAEYGEA